MSEKSGVKSMPEWELSDQKNWLRGQTPDDIRERCLTLCREYIGDIWLRVSLNEIVVNRISGGLTNQLYYCATDKTPAADHSGDVPREVAIRLYGAKHFNNDDNDGNERLTDVVIALLVSGTLGPKLYGIFDGGQIQKYYKHRSFRGEEQKNAQLVDQLARKLARVHALDVPLKRVGNWIFDSFDRYYKESTDRFALKALIDECHCETLKRHDLKTELEWLKSAILGTDSPITFTHIDFRGSNIMVCEPDDELVFCDFEYSGYGYRGADFGTIFAEWNGKLWSEPHILHNFPDDQTIAPFIRSYIDESTKAMGSAFSDRKCNSFDNILREVKVFSLVSNMFFIIMAIKSDKHFSGEDQPFDKKGSMIFAELNYKNYYHLKQLFIEQKVF